MAAAAAQGVVTAWMVLDMAQVTSAPKRAAFEHIVDEYGGVVALCMAMSKGSRLIDILATNGYGMAGTSALDAAADVLHSAIVSLCSDKVSALDHGRTMMRLNEGARDVKRREELRSAKHKNDQALRAAVSKCVATTVGAHSTKVINGASVGNSILT